MFRHYGEASIRMNADILRRMLIFQTSTSELFLLKELHLIFLHLTLFFFLVTLITSFHIISLPHQWASNKSISMAAFQQKNCYFNTENKF